MRHQLRAALGALLVVAALAAPAAASAATPPHHKKLTVTVHIKRFIVDRTGIRALGTASSTVGNTGTRRQVVLSVSRTATCSILALNLQNLRLQLLGLDIQASAINLRVTGSPDRTLGALFCKLSRATALHKAGLARATAASLNRRLHKRPMRAVAVRSTVYATSAQAGQPVCQVLDLIVGPLHLDLLGLIVDLYGPDRTKPVEVRVTADPSKGILGSTFCRLANQG